MRAAILLVLLAAPAAAQPVDCTADNLTIVEEARCADAALAEADAELDETYRLALTQAQVLDEETEVKTGRAPDPTTEALLEAAQDDFLDYRAAACAAETRLYEIEAEANIGAVICQARLAVRRTEDLRVFGTVE